MPTIAGLDHRLILLARAGVEATLVLRFDRELASWSPENFIRKILLEALGGNRLLLGFDSAFGRDRTGTFEFLRAREGELGIEVRRTGPLVLDGERVSSTLVRRAIASGDMSRLRVLLGRPYSILGEVVVGDRRGRELGIPTANIRLDARVVPPDGVYFAWAEEVEPIRRSGGCLEVDPRRRGFRPAVVNIGRRPTFKAADPTLLEAHLLDFEGDLYGKLLEVHLLVRHRAELKFDGPAALLDQVRSDIEAGREFLSSRATTLPLPLP